MSELVWSGEPMQDMSTIRRQLRGELYRRVLRFAPALGPYGLLVIRSHDWPPRRPGAALLAALEPYLVAREELPEWPGTRLLDDLAYVFTFRLTEPVVALLSDTVAGLYGWLAPELPEDLSLVRSDRTPWLVSIAHEKDAYLDVSAEERARLLEAIPELGEVIAPLPDAPQP